MWLETLCALLLAAPQSATDGRATQPLIEGRAIRGAIKSSERTIDDRVQQMTGRAPFVLLGTTRGAYLAGYGAVFTLELNLVPRANLSPFRPPYTPQEIKDLNREKRDKLGVLRTGFRQLLVDQGAGLGPVPASEKVAIVVTLFNYNWEDTTGLPSQVIFQAARQSLVDLQARRGQPDALDRAIEVKEF